jgi:hypothetical protein
MIQVQRDEIVYHLHQTCHLINKGHEAGADGGGATGTAAPLS